MSELGEPRPCTSIKEETEAQRGEVFSLRQQCHESQVCSANHTGHQREKFQKGRKQRHQRVSQF